MAYLEIQNVTFTYPGASAPTLQNINLTVRPGEYVVLCGCSGSGKTTLLRQFKPALTPTGQRSGAVLLDGAPIHTADPRTQAAAIGFVMQDPEAQIVTDKVWHELAFGLESLGVPTAEMRARVAEMASYFGIQDWFHRPVAQLSGGQKQLLNLASVMAMQPQVLILDEPTSQLDPIAAADFLSTVRRINTELGTTILLTEHRLEDILPYADRAVVLSAGKILADDTPRRVCDRLYREGHPLFSAMPSPARAFYDAGETGECPLTVREGRRWLQERFVQPPNRNSLPEQAMSDGSAATPVLEAQSLWFRYEKNSSDILRDVCLALETGKLHALLGGNGAGKSTLLRILCGVHRPYRGKVRLLGMSLKKYKAGKPVSVAMLPQDPKSLFVKKTVAEELEEMCNDGESVAQMAARCQITPLLQSHPYDLSGGEQQRVALAKVLLTSPRVLLLDEPTKGMDSGFKAAFAQILSGLTRQGLAVLMVSHDVEFCARYADVVSLFFDGQILTTGTPRRFFGGNSFYTTAASRMSRGVFTGAITAEDVAVLVRQNREE